MYSIHNYGEMIRDVGRMEAYERALRMRVKPGCVVADIGTGTGIFALLACRLGARRVYAVEPGEAIAVAREIAAANGFGDRIEFFEALSTEVDLPEKADVIVSDLRGVLPLFGRNLAALADARSRLLAPGGVMIPQRDEIRLALLESASAYRRISAPWNENAFGLDMRAAARVVANNFARIEARPEELLSAPQPVATLDLECPRDFDLRAHVRLQAVRAGVAHGLCAWFDSTLAPGVTFSNEPGKAALVYGNAFFPWPEAVVMEAGDAVEVELRADLVGQDYVWRWASNVFDAAGRAKARFSQSTFLAEVVSEASLRKRAASRVPVLSQDGEIEREILERMRGSKSIEEIAREIAAQFPSRFPRHHSALAYVGDVAARLGS